jgi:hypothetical protein
MADAKNSQDPFAMPNPQMMGMDPSQMNETFRAMTQKSMEQSKEAYHQGSLQLSKKAIDAMRSNAEAGFQHLDKMMSAKSFAEVIEMQTAYVRKQIEMATDQSKDMQALTQSVAKDMMKPGRDAFEKASKNAR